MNRIARSAAAVAFAAAATLTGYHVGAAAGPAGSSPVAVVRDSGTGLTVRGCPVRFSDVTLKPYIHQDNAHLCPGFRSVSIDDGDLVIRTDPAGPIIAAIASPDETMTARGISAGVSGGGELSRVRFGDTRAGARLLATDPRLYRDGTANVWILLVGLQS